MNTILDATAYEVGYRVVGNKTIGKHFDPVEAARTDPPFDLAEGVADNPPEDAVFLSVSGKKQGE